MTRVTRQGHYRRRGTRDIIYDKVGVAAICEPAKLLFDQWSICKLGQNLFQKLAHFTLIFGGHKGALVDTLWGQRCTGGRIGIDIPTTHRAQLQQSVFGIGFEEEAQVACICDRDACQGFGFGFCELNMGNRPRFGNHLPTEFWDQSCCVGTCGQYHQLSRNM